MAFKFENLEIGQEAVELTGIVHDVSDKFPSKELYVLTSQTKRAADSIALNIAEGSTSQSDPEFANFLRTRFDLLWKSFPASILPDAEILSMRTTFNSFMNTPTNL